MSNVLLVDGNPTQGGTDGVLVTADAVNPVDPDLLLTGNDAETPAFKLAIRTAPGYERAGPSAITPQGANVAKWALAPDNNGAPGVWGAWGAPLILANTLKSTNLVFWIKARVTSDESYPFLTNDYSVVLSLPDDAYLLVAIGKSLPMVSGILGGASRALGQPYTLRNLAGRSLEQVFAMTGTVGRSLDMPYLSGGPANRSLGMPYSVMSAIGRSAAMPYAVITVIGRSSAMPYEIASTSTFDDDFSSGSSPDTNRFRTSVSGSGAVSVASGLCQLSGQNSDDDAALLCIKNKLPVPSASRTVRWRGKINADSSHWGQNPSIAWLWRGASPGPVVSDNTAWNAAWCMRTFCGVYSLAGTGFTPALYLGAVYPDTTPGTPNYYWLQSDGTWSTAVPNSLGAGVLHSAATPPGGNGEMAAFVDSIFELDYNAGSPRVRVVFRDQAGTTILTSAWVPWSSIRGTTTDDLWACFGEPYNNFYFFNTNIDRVVVS